MLFLSFLRVAGWIIIKLIVTCYIILNKRMAIESSVIKIIFLRLLGNAFKCLFSVIGIYNVKFAFILCFFIIL